MPASALAASCSVAICAAPICCTSSDAWAIRFWVISTRATTSRETIDTVKLGGMTRIDLRRILILTAAMLLTGCTSFKAGQFSACIVTGRAACMITTQDEPAPKAEPAPKLSQG